MIKSILDNDLYKFTMQHAVVKLFPRAMVRYRFVNRGKTKFPDGFAKELQKYINKMKGLSLLPSEKEFIKKRCYYLDSTYIDFLNGYRFDPSEVHIRQKNGNLSIMLEGYWYRTILWEVPLLAIISELYFNMTQQKHYTKSKIINIAKEKALFYNNLGVKVADFGTRRRYSFNNHDHVVKTLTECGKPSFTGTSNVYLAKKYNLTPIGTHAHEWFMFHSVKYGYKTANSLSLEHWVDVYRGDLGIALSDTYTSDIFFSEFDKKLAKLFDGVRQDSGDPLMFADKTIKHYKKLNIDPMSKTIIFSDALTPGKVEKIVDHCRNRIRISFGIGTNFTNDTGVIPLNIVIKMTDAKPENMKWTPAVKLSDDKGKYLGNKKAIQLCKEMLAII